MPFGIPGGRDISRPADAPAHVFKPGSGTGAGYFRPAPFMIKRRQATMIEVEGLTKRYGDRVAVDRVSFQVHPGTVTGFLGPNGAGKSTTMRMIAGLDQPTKGRIRVNGGDYRRARAPMAELGVLL